jgi:hypothetical protein
MIKIRKTIYIFNAAIYIIKSCINNSKLVNNNLDKNLEKFNEIINPLLNDDKKTVQITAKTAFTDKIAELQEYVNNQDRFIKSNIKDFNNFIVDTNNISEIFLLYSKFSGEQRFLFNDNFVLYKDPPFDNLRYNMDTLSFYSENPNLSIFSEEEEQFYYRLPVPESNIWVNQTECKQQELEINKKTMMKLFGRSVAITYGIPPPAPAAAPVAAVNYMFDITQPVTKIIINTILNQIPDNGDTVNKKIKSIVERLKLGDLDANIRNNLRDFPNAGVDLTDPIKTLLQKIQIEIHANSLKDSIIDIIKDTIKDSIKKIGEIVGESRYNNSLANIKQGIEANITNNIVFAIKTVLSKIIEGIDPKVAKDTTINMVIKMTRDQLIGNNPIPLPLPVTTNMYKLQEELYGVNVDLQNALPLVVAFVAFPAIPVLPPMPPMPTMPIRNRLQNLINTTIDAVIREKRRQVPAFVVAVNGALALHIKDISFMSIIMVIAKENIMHNNNNIVDEDDDDYSLGNQEVDIAEEAFDENDYDNVR